MATLRALIVEDEKNSRDLLKELVEMYCEDIKVVALAGSVNEGVKAIDKQKPNLVFLDIELPGADGFQLLERRQPGNFEVIFTTAYDQYAIRAFKFSAIDYLLKPIDIEELQTAVQRAAEKISQDKQTSSVNLETLLQHIRTPKKLNRIILPSTQGFIVTNPEEILRCESDRNYTTFYFTTGKKLLVSRTIKDYEEMLSEYNFFRIHQSHLINLNYLKSYTRGRGGYVEMNDGTVLDVSARRKNDFLKRLSVE